MRLGNEAEEKLIGLPAEGQLDDNMIDEKLRLSGMLYFSIVDKLSDQASATIDVVSINHISMGYICDEIKPVGFFGIIWSITKGGSHIDVVRNVNCPTSTTGDQGNEALWMRMVGAIGTNMEHAMIEIVNEVEAVSTGKIFYKASEQGIAIHILDDPETLETDLAVISAYSTVKNHIRAHVNAGYTAMIPQRGVTVGSWSGQGWIVMDEETGAAGYMICGGLHNENTLINGGSGTTIIDNLLSTFQAFLYKLVPGASALGIAGAILYGMSYYLGSLPLVLFMGGLIFGYIFLLFGIALLIASFYTPPLSIWVRRREYAYA